MKDFFSSIFFYYNIKAEESVFKNEEWLSILEKLAMDGGLFEHSQKVTYYAIKIFDDIKDEWQLTDNDRKTLFFSAFLHDIGKLFIHPEELLNKEAQLTEKEFTEIKRHPVLGYEFISKFDPLKPVLFNILHHHERYDGKGYPNGVGGESIPPLARIISVADSFDAMTSLRPYRKINSADSAFNEIYVNAGCQFDPYVAESFVHLRKYCF